MDQLLETAVRSVSAFGLADEMIEDEEAAATETLRSTLKTAQFLRQLRRHVAGDDANLRSRFNKRLKLGDALPEVTIDYAFNEWMVQVTSLPATQKQSSNTIKESQSKLFEIELLRDAMLDTPLRPVLLVNEDILAHSPSDAARDEAARMLDRLRKLTSSRSVDLIEAPTPESAAKLVRALA